MLFLKVIIISLFSLFFSFFLVQIFFTEFRERRQQKGTQNPLLYSQLLQLSGKVPGFVGGGPGLQKQRRGESLEAGLGRGQPSLQLLSAPLVPGLRSVEGNLLCCHGAELALENRG